MRRAGLKTGGICVGYRARLSEPWTPAFAGAGKQVAERGIVVTARGQ